MSRAARSRLVALQRLRGVRGVNRSWELSASRLRWWLSIHPKHNACSIASW